MKNLFTLLASLFIYVNLVSCGHNRECYDVVVIGGGTSGVAAGIESARLGAKTVILEESLWLGGMLTSAGVSAVDGNYNLPAGIWGEFLDSLVVYYGHLDSLKTGWVSNVQFEPSVGNRIFQNMAAAEPNLKVFHNAFWKTVKRDNGKWAIEYNDINGERHQIFSKFVIDATELGDVAKSCGVAYDKGMESSEITGEDIAPLKSNGIIQDLTYVAVVKDYDYDVSIEKPEGYDPQLFGCCCDNEQCLNPTEGDVLWSSRQMLDYGKLPNNKYMLNWPIQGNDYYVDMIEITEEERAEAVAKAKHQTLCYLYFIQNELGYKNIGLADDEFPTEDRLPLIPYHRESRRIHGKVRFTLNHIMKPYEQKEKLYRTCIAVGDYPVDHHHKRYTGDEQVPKLTFHPVPSYGLPLGVIVPEDVDGLLVAEKSISVSNIVNGTTRLQPVVLQIGQAAGAMAALAARNNSSLDEVEVRDVQKVILDGNGYLLPYLDVKVGDKMFKPLQRIGVTGILKGEGRNIGWSNQTWFRASDKLLMSELQGLMDFYPEECRNMDFSEEPVTVSKAAEILSVIKKDKSINSEDSFKNVWSDCGLEKYDWNRILTRGEMAVLIDYVLNPFENFELNINGEIKR